MSLFASMNRQWDGFHLETEFSIESGCLGILGESGCGKSMTLKGIAGLIPLDHGKIVLNDTVLYDSSKKICLKPQARKTGYLFQNYALFPNMTVRENIGAALPKMNKKKKTELIESYIHQFHLETLQEHYPSELSGGQQQRTALARIFAYGPRVLLLDEPFTALDANLRDQMRLELKAMIQQYQGITILVTHDRDEAYQLCDQVLLMDHGHKLMQDMTREVFEHPCSYQAARLTGCKNLSKAKAVDDHHVLAIDWNLLLTIEHKVPARLDAIGIRAHDLKPVNAGAKLDNTIRVTSWNIVELPFEWHVTVNGTLFWKVEKELHSHDSTGLIPEMLYVPADRILLLEESI